jgi:rhodanese-related sulfurtransferase
MRQLVDTGGPMEVIDVRTAGEFEQLHVKGARSVPLDQLDPTAIAGSRKNPEDPIYVICHSGARSGNAQEQLTAAGVPNVLSIEGGTSAWEKSGLPVIHGRGGVISLERQVRIGAGALVVLGVILGFVVHRGFFALPAFVGSGLVFAGVTDYCGMGMLLAKMPWNK